MLALQLLFMEQHTNLPMCSVNAYIDILGNSYSSKMVNIQFYFEATNNSLTSTSRWLALSYPFQLLFMSPLRKVFVKILHVKISKNAFLSGQFGQHSMSLCTKSVEFLSKVSHLFCFSSKIRGFRSGLIYTL